MEKALDKWYGKLKHEAIKPLGEGFRGPTGPYALRPTRFEDQEASEGGSGAGDALRAEPAGGDEQQALGVPQQRGSLKVDLATSLNGVQGP